jgi:hypothetical protein
LLSSVSGVVERWRAEALRALPELRQLLENEKIVFSPYALWFELLPRVRQAHRDHDDDFLARAYSLADWCRRQPEKDLWNSVGVCFYEHLFDEVWMRPLVARWLSREAVVDAWGLWEYFLPPDAMAEVRTLLRGLGPEPPP